MSIEIAARKYAGNHESFDSFCWFDAPEDAEQWAIVYTHNRDSSILDRCNAEAIAKALAPFEDARESRHNHWVCGWVEGFAIRVYRDGQITEAFQTYYDLQCKMNDYPVLDESRLGEMEQDEIASSWENWAHQDFERAIEKRFGVETIGDVRPLWDSALDRGYAEWVQDDSGMTINVGRIVAKLDVDDVLPILETGASEATEIVSTRLINSIIDRPDVGIIYAAAGCNPASIGIPGFQPLDPFDAAELHKLFVYLIAQHPEIGDVSDVIRELDHIASIIDR